MIKNKRHIKPITRGHRYMKSYVPYNSTALYIIILMG